METATGFPPSHVRTVTPSVNVTVPWFTVLVLVTVAVNVTESFGGPVNDGLRLEDTDVEVEAGTGAVTSTLAIATVLLPPSGEVAVTLLFCVPRPVAVTFSDSVQELPALSDAPERLTVPDPGVAVAVPLQVVVRPLGFETTKPEGRRSVKLTVREERFPAGLPTIKDKLVLLASTMLGEPNILEMVGGAITLTLVVEVFPVPPSVEVTVTLFDLAPALVPVTFTEKLHVAPAESVAPNNETEPVPWVAVIVPPPQLSLSPFGVETTSPLGRVSVKPMPVRDAGLPAGFII